MAAVKDKPKPSGEAELKQKLSKYIEEVKNARRQEAAITAGKAAVSAAKTTASAVGNVAGAAGATVGATAAGAAKLVSSNVFSLLFLLSIVNFYFDYVGGFQHDFKSMGIDFVTMMLFAMSGLKLTGDFKNSPFLFFLAETFMSFLVTFFLTLPGITNELFLTISGFLLVAPWWILYCLSLKLQGIGQSRIVDWTIWIALLLIAFSLLYSPTSEFSLGEYAINQKAVDSFQNFFLNFKEDIINPAIDNVRYAWCGVIGDDLCVQELDKERNKDVLEQNFNVKELPGSSFTMNIASFVTPNTILFENEQSTEIEATTSFMPSPIKLTFACGLYKRGPGTPDPSEITLALGSLYASQGNINCENLDISTKTTRSLDFYFNVTANGVVSTGERTLLVMDESAKDAVLSKYPGISESKIILASKEFGELVKAQQDVLGSVVSKDDLVQPLMLLGGTTTISAKQSLIYGISQSRPVPFALYIKNNGKGNIAKLSGVKFALPEDLTFDDVNCGLTQETLNKIDWRKVPRGSIGVKIASCNLIIKGTEFPNNVQSRSIGVELAYDYVLSKSESVKIVPESEAYTASVPLGDSAPVLVN